MGRLRPKWVPLCACRIGKCTGDKISAKSKYQNACKILAEITKLGAFDRRKSQDDPLFGLISSHERGAMFCPRYKKGYHFDKDKYIKGSGRSPPHTKIQ